MTNNPFGTVPQRTDRAWLQGYTAGKSEWKKVALVELVIGALVLLRRRRVPDAVWFLVAGAVMVALCVAAVVLPVLGIIWVLRCAIRHHRASLPVTRVTLDDGQRF